MTMNAEMLFRQEMHFALVLLQIPLQPFPLNSAPNRLPHQLHCGLHVLS